MTSTWSCTLFFPMGTLPHFMHKMDDNCPMNCSTIAFYCCNSVCGATLIYSPPCKISIGILKCYLSDWSVNRAHDKYTGDSFQHGKKKEKDKKKKSAFRALQWHYIGLILLPYTWSAGKNNLLEVFVSLHWQRESLHDKRNF